MTLVKIAFGHSNPGQPGSPASPVSISSTIAGGSLPTSNSSSSLPIIGAWNNTPGDSPASSSFPVAAGSSTIGAATPTSSSSSLTDFDVALDDSIGYLNPNATGFWAQLLPGVPAADLPQSAKRLRRRGFDFSSVVSTLAQASYNSLLLCAHRLTSLQGVQDAVNAAGSAVSDIQTEYQSVSTSFTDAVSSAVSTVANAAVTALNALSPFSLGPVPFNIAPGSSVSTPFGSGVILNQESFTDPSLENVDSQITLYCIGCGVSGSFSVTGSITFDASQGLTGAVFDVTGNIAAQLELALEASISGSQSIEQNLGTLGLPGLTIPGLLVVGPSVSLDVGATVNIDIEGGIAAGYQLDFPAISSHLDLFNNDYSASGFTPLVTPIFDFETNITDTTTIYSLLSLRFGLNILNGKYQADVGLVDKPEVDSTATFTVYSEYDLADLPDGQVICEGVAFTIGVQDSVYAELAFGKSGSSIATKTYPLTAWSGPSTSTCFG
jgi:hypothetical protein